LRIAQKLRRLLLSATSSSTNELLSYKTDVAPTIDGVVDAVWDKATKLEVTPTVPDPGNGLFAWISSNPISCNHPFHV
jgi:hypothetical protein